nr:hypothetical protein [Evansella caseinilytica]
MNKHDATSRASLRSCELSHSAIAGDGTWMSLCAILAEKETMEWSRCILFRPAVGGFLESG